MKGGVLKKKIRGLITLVLMVTADCWAIVLIVQQLSKLG